MLEGAWSNRWRSRLSAAPVRLIGAAIAVFLTSILPTLALVRVAHLLPVWAEPRLTTAAVQALVLAALYAVLKVRPAALSPAPVCRAGLVAGAWFVLGTLSFSLLVTFTMFPWDATAGNVAKLVSRLTQDFPTTGLAGRLAHVVLLVPVFEEFLYRGLILGHLMRGFPAWLALAASTLLFAAGHGSWVLSGLIGLALGLLYVRYRNLWLCVLVHGAHNLVSSTGASLLVARLRDEQVPMPIVVGALPFQAAGLAIVVACLGMFVAALFARIEGGPFVLLRRSVGRATNLRT